MYPKGNLGMNSLEIQTVLSSCSAIHTKCCWSSCAGTVLEAVIQNRNVGYYLGELQHIWDKLQSILSHRGAVHTQNEGTQNAIYIVFTKCHTNITAPYFHFHHT